MEEKRIIIEATSKKPIFISEAKHDAILALTNRIVSIDDEDLRLLRNYLKEVREALKDADAIIHQCNDRLTKEFVEYHNLKGELANQKSEFAKELAEKDRQIIKIKRKISGVMINMLLDL